MDEINDFFDLTKEFKRAEAPIDNTSGSSRRSSIAETSKPLKHAFVAAGIADELVSKKKLKIDELDIAAPEKRVKLKSNMDHSDSDDEIQSDEDQPETCFNDTYYDKYTFNLNRESNLPIYEKRKIIMATIEKNPVVILEGDTGCGKTTQVPQYILDEACRRRQYCNIVCTQPRRIAAISIAKRICEERKWREGSVCSYQVGLHSNQNEDTRLLYCTTGVLLQRLVRDKSLAQFTHIVLDEVHERDQKMDLLLLVIRRLLTTNSRHVKVILMSATINTTQFANYFTIRKRPSPVLRVDSRRNYHVQEFYTNHLTRINADAIEVSFEDPGISDEMYCAALKLLVVIENMEKQEQAQVALEQNAAASSILVFLPGFNEIDQFDSKICALLQSQQTIEEDNMKLKFYTIRLHSLISPEEQIRAFRPPPDGFRKVILATNIAESSITVPDVKYVIDFCLTKLVLTNSATKFSSLQLQWAARTNCHQRAGRAGRVMNGRVYRMVPKDFFDNLEEFPTPELVRCPLEKIVLKVKILDMGSPCDILRLAIDPPNICDIRNTILSLKEVNALYSTSDGRCTQYDGDISYWGRIMDSLPLDVRLSRLIIIGYMFSCFEETIIIAAGLSVRGLFLWSNIKNKVNNRTYMCDEFIKKLFLADGSGCDLIVILRAYKLYKIMRASQQSDASEKAWARNHFLNIRSLREMDLLISDLDSRLRQLNIKQSYLKEKTNSFSWNEREKAIILKIVIAGAFYPNYYLRENKNVMERERSIYHLLSGRDPCHTVYFTNFQARTMGELYTHSIKEFFQCVNIPPKDMEVTFQQGSERVFVTFKSDEFDDENHKKSAIKELRVPGRINPNVIKALRIRLDRKKHNLQTMETSHARRYVEEQNIGVVIDGVWHPSGVPKKDAEITVLPSVFTKKMRGYISHVRSCRKFFFQPLSEIMTLQEIQTLINEPNEVSRNCIPVGAHIRVGMVVAASRNKLYQRGVVLKLIENRRGPKLFMVHFIDFGNTAVLRLEDLRYFSDQNRAMKDYPPRVIKCRLAGVQPFVLASENNTWNELANNELQKISEKGVVEIEIYSLVGDLSSVIILEEDCKFNERLVTMEYARKADEDYMSKMDHDFRMRKQAVGSRFTEDQRNSQNEEYLLTQQPPIDFDLTPPELSRCNKTTTLIGPYSPLETQMYSLLQIGASKSVNIQSDSVNAVLLNTDPHDLHDNMIVASSVNEWSCGNKLTVRSTSLMPNIHGFAALMIMLFCPRMQLKCNKTRTKYVSLLAGLGYNDETMRSLYEEHDMVLKLDVDLLQGDIYLINKLRYLMDTMFHTINKDEASTCPANAHGLVAENIRKTLFRLLNKNRFLVEPHFNGDEHKWEKPGDDEIQTMENAFGNRTLFHMHNIPRLYEEKFEVLHSLNEHCKELHYLRQFDGSFQPMTCQLCNEDLENINHLRLHLLSKLHCDREQQIGFMHIEGM